MSVPSIPLKKPYHSPQLKTYGDIKTLTLALSDGNINRDSVAGSPAPFNKTF
ncbi:hypothetical protein [Oscillatoria sp. FACHB-1406]|uniref:hypothetical protein n=1 Tax=Oscillatoria sp. FACHB-1406 TaxID=2692846 RepID=UPI001684F82E|nr:hypothetical protein [Oscillatoria sp. FACHB-1406]MBD2577738.1 hypothetical protein [Oscillatoria sp. FACHB-1406]